MSAAASPPSAEPLLEVCDLEVAYGAAPALWGVSIEVRAGELLSIVGPNGAGKTTLINAIAGIQPARAGRLVFAGRDITRLPSGTMAMPASQKRCGASVVRSRPSSRILPARVRSMPETALIRVVLPAPFGPTTQSSSPAPSLSETPQSAGAGP